MDTSCPGTSNFSIENGPRPSDYHKLEFDIFSDSLLISLDSSDLLSISDIPADGVDFLAEFGRFPHIINQVLGYLTPKDLANACTVSKVWKGIIRSNSKANTKRLDYLYQIRALRERVGQVCLITIASPEHTINNSSQHT